MFNTGQQPNNNPEDDDVLEATRTMIPRFPILKWQDVGTYVELAVVNYSDTAAVKENGVQKTRTFVNNGETVVKAQTQDVITGLVIGGNALFTPLGEKDRLEVVIPGIVVTQFVSGHNRWDPNRAEAHGKTWRDAKDVLGRGLMTGDLVRIDYSAFLTVASNGRPLQNGKKVMGFMCRPLGGSPEELAILEAARKARREMKANQSTPAAPSQPGFRPAPVATTPQTPAAPQMPTPPASAVNSLFQ